MGDTKDGKSDKIKEMAKYTTAEMREKCWEVRDECFGCLDSSHNRGKCRKVCQSFFSGEFCLKSWIKHFSNKLRYANAWDFYRKQRMENTTDLEEKSIEEC